MTKNKPAGTHLFIDTNILLGFYAYTKDDLNQLEKLLALIAAKAIKLYLTDQVVDEFVRNREIKLDASFRQFQKTSIEGCPSFMKSLDKYQSYDEALVVFQKAQSEFLNQAKELAYSRALPADELFDNLRKSAKIIGSTPEHYNAALARKRLGNPPGKLDSLGDQLNWEILLTTVPEGSDLHVISQDADFSSKLNPALPKDFLADEWTRKREGTLHLYQQIGQFFKENYPGEKFSLQIEKKTAIQSLVNSENFAATHSAVSLLDPYISVLTADEAEEVVQGALSNSQVAWIASDADVKRFLTTMLNEHGDSLSPALRNRLKEAVCLVDADALDPAEPVDVSDYDE